MIKIINFIFILLISILHIGATNPRNGQHHAFGAAASLSTKSETNKQQILNANSAEDKEKLHISLGLKRYDGGTIEIYLPENGSNGQSEEFTPHMSSTIEEIFKKYYKVDVKYIKGQWKEFASIGVYSGYIEFLTDGFGWRKEAVATIWEVLQKVSKEDPSRWVMAGKSVKKHHQVEQFQPLFDGHAMVILLKIGKNDSEKQRQQPEAFGTFHFLPTGLKIFKKIRNGDKTIGKTYTVVGDQQQEIEDTEEQPKIRGPYFPVKFSPPLLVDAKFAYMAELKRVGQRVIGNKKYALRSSQQAPFTCMHFFYKFILAIITDDERKQKLLREHNAWPEELRKLEMYYAMDLVMPKPFDDVVAEISNELE